MRELHACRMLGMRMSRCELVHMLLPSKLLEATSEDLPVASGIHRPLPITRRAVPAVRAMQSLIWPECRVEWWGQGGDFRFLDSKVWHLVAWVGIEGVGSGDFRFLDSKVWHLVGGMVGAVQG